MIRTIFRKNNKHHKLVPIGTIMSTHGYSTKLKASVNIDENRFHDILMSNQSVIISTNGINKTMSLPKKYSDHSYSSKHINHTESATYQAKKVSFYKGIAIVDFGLPDINEAKNLVGKTIFASRDIFNEEVLSSDLIGMKVYRKYICFKFLYGTVIDIPDYGSGTLVEILPSCKKETELYTFTTENFSKIDKQNNFLILKKS